MHEAFETRFGTLNTDKVFTTSEISYYLNLAQRQLFEELLPKFDVDDRIKMIFYGLLKSTVIIDFETNTLGSKPYSKTVVLPDDFKVAKGESARISSSNGEIKVVRVKSVSQDYYNLNINNPFKKPCDDLVWRLDAPEYESSLSVEDESELNNEIPVT